VPAPADPPADPSAIVTLTRCGELTTAQLLRGRLDAEGIECFIPDEHLAAQTWHLTRAIGGIRVQVRQVDMERAQQVLALPGTCEDEEGASESGQHKPNGVNGTDTDDGSISVGDRAGYRALRVALVSLWLMGLIHPYSLLLAVQALGRPDLTAWGRRRAAIALLVSLAGCAWMAFLVYRFWKLSR
jgi:hypothetical protein